MVFIKLCKNRENNRKTFQQLFFPYAYVNEHSSDEVVKILMFFLYRKGTKQDDPRVKFFKLNLEIMKKLLHYA